MKWVTFSHESREVTTAGRPLSTTHLSTQGQSLIRLTAQLLTQALGVALLLNLTLVLGQLIKLSRALSLSVSTLWMIDEWSSSLFAMVMWATPVMWEATAPLLALVTTATCYHGLKQEGFDLAWRSAGLSPALYLAPALFVSTLLGLSALYSAHYITPTALQRIANQTQSLASQVALKELTAGGEPVGGLTTPDSSRLALTRAYAWRDPERNELWLWSPPEERYLSAKLSSQPIVSMGDHRASGELNIQLSDVRLWSPELELNVKELSLTLRSEGLMSQLKSLSAPNNVPSERLGESAHERFTFHKRSALPSSALAWGLLGALLGLLGRAQRASLISVLCIGGAYTLLRALELRARFGGGDPTFAAWCPTLALSVISLVTLSLWLRRGGRW